MTDPLETEPSGKPDEGVLGALAEPARRPSPQREDREGGPVPDGPGDRSTPLAGALAGASPHFWERLLQASVVIVGALVLGLGSAAVTLGLSGHTVSPSATTRTSQAQGRPSATSNAGRPVHARRPTGTARRAGAVRRPTTSAQQGPPGTPQLLSLSPTRGHAGDVVTVSGVNLFSADGVVQALLGGQAAPTSCPTETACTVTVPTWTGPPSTLPLTIETEAGTSNALSFTYG